MTASATLKSLSTWTRCGRCETRWTSASQLHCSGCHQQFGSLAVFEAHRVNGHCVDLTGTNFIKVTLKGCTIPVWRSPKREDDES